MRYGVTFQNVTAVATSVVGHPDVLRGCAEAAWCHPTFVNGVIARRKLISLEGFAQVNVSTPHKNVTEAASSGISPVQWPLLPTTLHDSSLR